MAESLNQKAIWASPQYQLVVMKSCSAKEGNQANLRANPGFKNIWIRRIRAGTMVGMKKRMERMSEMKMQ